MAEGPPEQADLRSLLAQVIEELAQVRRVQDEMRRAQDEHIRIQEARLVALELRNENLEAAGAARSDPVGHRSRYFVGAAR